MQYDWQLPAAALSAAICTAVLNSPEQRWNMGSLRPVYHASCRLEFERLYTLSTSIQGLTYADGQKRSRVAQQSGQLT